MPFDSVSRPQPGRQQPYTSAVKLAYLDQAEWVRVQSSNVHSVWYQPDFKYLWIKFNSGSVYLYMDVDPGVYQGLLAAPSKGEYVYYVVRAKGTDSRFPFEKVARPPA